MPQPVHQAVPQVLPNDDDGPPSSDAPSQDTDRAVDLALARGVLYRVLAGALRHPTDETIASLQSPDGRATLRAATRELDDCARGGDTLEPAAERFASATTLSLDAAERAYARLFGHTARGVVCPYETEYGAAAPFQQPHALADIAGTYRAFGLQPRPSLDERVDHVGCETEFMGFLAVKEAYGVQATAANVGGATRETLEVTQGAARSFLTDHLARFGLAFATQLEREDPAGFFGAVGALLAGVIRFECARLEVAPGPVSLELREAEDPEAMTGCETAPDLLQIQRRADPARPGSNDLGQG